MNNDTLKSSDEMLRLRYSKRYQDFGYDPKTLGWDTSLHQRARFLSACRALPKNSEFSVCDIGCGFGDFRSTLTEAKYNAVYRGIDINPDLIAEARLQHPSCQFDVRNILLDSRTESLADWVCAFGVLNFKFGQFDNEVFARQFIARAFRLAKRGLIVDMLSTHACDSYPKEDFVYYYSPEKLLSFAFELTPNIQLFHDYAPIPQREFQLVLKHTAEDCLL